MVKWFVPRYIFGRKIVGRLVLGCVGLFIIVLFLYKRILTLHYFFPLLHNESTWQKK